MGLEEMGGYLVLAVLSVSAGYFIRKRIGAKRAKKIAILLYLISIVFMALGFMQRYHNQKLVKKLLQAQEIWVAAEQITSDEVDAAVLASIWQDKEEYEALWIEKEAEKDKRLDKPGQALRKLGEISLHDKKNASKSGMIYQNSSGDYIVEIEGIYFKKRSRYHSVLRLPVPEHHLH